jgi:hypothetical protein
VVGIQKVKYASDGDGNGGTGRILKTRVNCMPSINIYHLVLNSKNHFISLVLFEFRCVLVCNVIIYRTDVPCRMLII